jgi:hypothetical protein
MSLGYLLPHVETAIFNSVENEINFFPTLGFCQDNAFQAEGGQWKFPCHKFQIAFLHEYSSDCFFFRYYGLMRLTYFDEGFIGSYGNEYILRVKKCDIQPKRFPFQ